MSDKKERILKVFVDLLSKKNLDEITVSEIADVCKISRQTFYYYFDDIVDIVLYLLYSVAYGDNDTISKLDGMNKELIKLLKWNKENKIIINNIYKSDFYLKFYNIFREEFYKKIYFTIKDKGKGLTINEEQYDFIAQFYSNAIISMLDDWIEKGMETDPEVLLQNIYIVLKSSFKNVLMEFYSKNNN